MRVGVIHTFREVGRKGVVWLQITALIIAGIAPAFMDTPVEAAQLTSRKVTISTSEISTVDVGHVFSYTIPNTAAAKQGIIYDFCTTAVGACTLPTGMDVQTAATHDAQTGWPDDITPTNFARYTGADSGDCVLTAITYRLCFNRTEATTGGGAVTHTISGITSPSVYGTVYIRVTVYSDSTFVTDLDNGTVASAYVRQLTVTGRVTERLRFCVGAIDDGDGGGVVADNTPADCDTGFPTNTEVAIGVIDNSDIYVTPVEGTTSNLANDRYGIALVNTNASGGLVVTYFVEPATNVTGGDTDQLRTFRVSPTDCSATTTSLTDQCFVPPATDNTSETFTQGQERFGMYIPCVDNRHDAITTQNLTVNAEYDGTDGLATNEINDIGASSCQFDEAPTNVDFAWNSTSTPFAIASSSTVIDNEAIKLAFGATASPTTPEGSYSATLTYIATPTF